MKTIKRLTVILSFLLLTACGASWQATTLNHDPIYDDGNYALVTDGVKVDTLNAFQFRNKLRTDFNFRYDFAQYALSQPRSFDWNNRILGNRYNWNRNYWGSSYYSYWNRTQMWNDWVWGFTPHGYDMWGYNNWMGNAHWGYSWNNYYGWNGWYNNQWGWRNQMNDYAWQHRNRTNTAYINGRRGSNNNIASNNTIENNIINKKPSRVRVNRTVVKPPVAIVNTPVVVIKPVRRNTIIPPVRSNNNNIRINNNTNRNNNNRPSYNNRRPINNSRPVIINRTNTSTKSTNVNRSNSRGGNGGRKK